MPNQATAPQSLTAAIVKLRCLLDTGSDPDRDSLYQVIDFLEGQIGAQHEEPEVIGFGER